MNAYSVLNVPPTATKAEIRAAYRALARRWQARPPLPLTPAGRQLVLETLRLIWQPQACVLEGIDALRARAAVMLRVGDASGLHEAGAYLGAAL